MSFLYCNNNKFTVHSEKLFSTGKVYLFASKYIQMNESAYFCCCYRCRCDVDGGHSKHMNGIDESCKSQTEIYSTQEEHKNQIIFLMLPLNSCSYALFLSTFIFFFAPKSCSL